MTLGFERCPVCGERFDARRAPARADGRRLCDACAVIARLLAALPHPAA
jgi:formylmethanofuran dehydrogenase subunit E